MVLSLCFLLSCCCVPLCLDPGDPNDLHQTREAVSVLPAGPREVVLPWWGGVPGQPVAGAHADLKIRAGGLWSSLQQGEQEHLWRIQEEGVWERWTEADPGHWGVYCPDSRAVEQDTGADPAGGPHPGQVVAAQRSHVSRSILTVDVGLHRFTIQLAKCLYL